MITGHCLCGKVRYEVTGTPLAMMYCHCEECRRATGSSLNTSLFVKREQFRIVSGESSVAFHETSPDNLRHFCSSCGSPLFKYFVEPTGMMTIRAGTLDSDPGVRPIDGVRKLVRNELQPHRRNVPGDVYHHDGEFRQADFLQERLLRV